MPLSRMMSWILQSSLSSTSPNTSSEYCSTMFLRASSPSDLILSLSRSTYFIAAINASRFGSTS